MGATAGEEQTRGDAEHDHRRAVVGAVPPADARAVERRYVEARNLFPCTDQDVTNVCQIRYPDFRTPGLQSAIESPL